MKMEKMRAERSGAEKVTVKVKVKNQQQEGRNDEASERISSEIEARRAKSEKKGERRRKERKSEQIGAWARARRERENFWRFRLPLFFFPHPRSISFVSFNCSHPLHSSSVWLDTIQLLSSDLCCELTDELLSLVFF